MNENEKSFLDYLSCKGYKLKSAKAQHAPTEYQHGITAIIDSSKEPEKGDFSRWEKAKEGYWVWICCADYKRKLGVEPTRLAPKTFRKQNISSLSI